MKPQSFDRLRALINEARLGCESPNHCPSIVHKMMTPEWLGKLRLEGLDERLIAAGLNYEIRDYLKGNREDDRATKPQLEMWSEKQRATVKAIDREKVFVPSRGEFVPLVPAEITKAEVIEAGEYLIAHGSDAIKRGQLLKDLGKVMA